MSELFLCPKGFIYQIKEGGKRLAARAASDLLEGKCLPPSPRIQNLARE
jgi:hypothetical protein